MTFDEARAEFEHVTAIHDRHLWERHGVRVADSLKLRRAWRFAEEWAEREYANSGQKMAPAHRVESSNILNNGEG